jgi:hypothetical protein
MMAEGKNRPESPSGKQVVYSSTKTETQDVPPGKSPGKPRVYSAESVETPIAENALVHLH